MCGKFLGANVLKVPIVLVGNVEMLNFSCTFDPVDRYTEFKYKTRASLLDETGNGQAGQIRTDLVQFIYSE